MGAAGVEEEEQKGEEKGVFMAFGAGRSRSCPRIVFNALSDSHPWYVSCVESGEGGTEGAMMIMGSSRNFTMWNFPFRNFHADFFPMLSLARMPRRYY